MKPVIRFTIFYLIVCNVIIACRHDNSLQPAILNNLPSGIIVKQKDSSGVFQIKEQYKLFPDSNHIFFDSIQIAKTAYTNYITSILFDYSLYNTKNLVVLNYNGWGVDSINANVLEFENGRINRLYAGYDLISFQPYDIGLKFDYNDSLLYWVDALENTPDINAFHFNTTYFGNDSFEISSLDGSNFNFNFYYRAYYNQHPNNTNSLILSGYPFLKTNVGNYPESLVCDALSVIPFPKLHTNLVGYVRDIDVDSIAPKYIRQPDVNYNYTYDENGRVKTAIVNNLGTEFMIEYKY